ncbi:acyl carrier protein [Clostridium sp. WILCCON 0269]|uniref:Acyl carrier protein n=1 Tax=Candidatus Clostridium eludens TaxID=3381663 RepID=A0ABW8SH07_9CLOT
MFEKVVETIAKYSGIEAEEIHMDSLLINDLAINSYTMMEMICDIEEELDIDIPEEAIKELRSVGDVVQYLEKNTK